MFIIVYVLCKPPIVIHEYDVCGKTKVNVESKSGNGIFFSKRRTFDTYTGCVSQSESFGNGISVY